MTRVVDADAHVLEGATFMAAALERWPDKMAFVAEHGVSTAQGIDPGSPAGIVGDADREGMNRMVLFPSFGLGIPSVVDQAFAGQTCEFYYDPVAQWCQPANGRLRAAAVVPVEDVEASVRALEQAKNLGLFACSVTTRSGSPAPADRAVAAARRPHGMTPHGPHVAPRRRPLATGVGYGALPPRSNRPGSAPSASTRSTSRSRNIVPLTTTASMPLARETSRSAPAGWS